MPFCFGVVLKHALGSQLEIGFKNAPPLACLFDSRRLEARARLALTSFVPLRLPPLSNAYVGFRSTPLFHFLFGCRLLQDALGSPRPSFYASCHRGGVLGLHLDLGFNNALLFHASLVAAYVDLGFRSTPACRCLFNAAFFKVR